jgi:predicted acyl esterase
MNRLIRTFLLLAFVWTPPGLHAFKIQTLMMPMSDGVKLATDIYLPTFLTKGVPCLLMRTPYGKASGMKDFPLTSVIDLMGYAVAIQDTRGRYDSGGEDSLYFSDGWGSHRDGYETVEWLARQSWSNGRIGMLGASATGITTYLAAGTRPPHLACGVAVVAASNLFEDAAFDCVNLTARFDSVNVPILHVGGWHDIFTQGILNAFTGIQENGGSGARGRQRLIMGPWVHDVQSSFCGELTFPGSDASSERRNARV